MESKRRFPRHEMDIPCSVLWGGTLIGARLSNISQGGAKISKPTAVPPKESSVTVEFEFEGRPFALKAHLSSRVVYSIPRALDSGEAGYFGVEFIDPPEEIRTQLSSIFESVEKRPREVSWKLVLPIGVCKYRGQWYSMVCISCDEGPYVCDDCTTKHLEARLAKGGG